MEDKEAKSIIEAILFMSGTAVTLDSLRTIIEIDKYNTERLVKELIGEYTHRNSGLMVLEVAGGYQMVTNPACAPWLKKLLSTALPKKLSQSSLETLAIVAYKQPIIKSEIEAVRGVNSDGVIKTLLERRLIKMLGRKEAPGRPLMYGTTTEFLQYFGLKDLSELPTLKEFEEVDVPEAPGSTSEGMTVLESMRIEGEMRDGMTEGDPDSEPGGMNGELLAEGTGENGQIPEGPAEEGDGTSEGEQEAGTEAPGEVQSRPFE